MSTKLLAYNLTEEASCFLHHILCIVRIQVLRDVCIGMSKACCDINRLCLRLNQSCCMGMTKTVRIEPRLSQNNRDEGVMERDTIRTDTDERTAQEVIRRRKFLRKKNQSPIIA